MCRTAHLSASWFLPTLTETKYGMLSTFLLEWSFQCMTDGRKYPVIKCPTFVRLFNDSLSVCACECAFYVCTVCVFVHECECVCVCVCVCLHRFCMCVCACIDYVRDCVSRVCECLFLYKYVWTFYGTLYEDVSRMNVTKPYRMWCVLFCKLLSDMSCEWF